MAKQLNDWERGRDTGITYCRPCDNLRHPAVVQKGEKRMNSEDVGSQPGPYTDKPAPGLGFLALFAGFPALVPISVAVAFSCSWLSFYVVLLFQVGVVLFVVHAAFSTKYVIHGGTLLAKSGILPRAEIPLESILSAEKIPWNRNPFGRGRRHGVLVRGYCNRLTNGLRLKTDEGDVCLSPRSVDDFIEALSSQETGNGEYHAVKRVRWVLLACVLLFAGAAVLPFAALRIEARHVAAMEPLTDGILDTVEAGLQNAADVVEEKVSGGDPVAAAPLLRKDVLRFGEAMTDGARRSPASAVSIIDEKANQAVYAGSLLFGEDESSRRAWWVAVAKMQRHDWPGAEYYLRRVMLTSPDTFMRRMACAHLAWLVDDPKMAARLLRLSVYGEPCQNGRMVYPYIVRLCQDTGNTELGAYYLSQYRECCPEKAERLFPAADTPP